MEWRQQSSVSCELAFQEAQRWLEEVTKKRFGSKSFRCALEDGVLLCDLINTLKPGIIKRVNRLSTPIAGLDNVNVFLKACKKLGLNEAQLFHPGDLQDVSNRVTVRREETSRRLKNVLITIYWLGRKAQVDPFYTGPQLNLKAFEGLLGVALSKALEESVQSKSSVRDSGYAEGWYSDREDLLSLKQPDYSREDSVESLDSVESRTLSVASDCTLRAGSEGCCSDAEAEHCFRMADGSRTDGPSRERVYVPSVLRRKRMEHQEEGRGYTGPLTRSKSMGDITLEPIPQESDNCSTFDHKGPRHVHQSSVEDVTLNPSAMQRVQYEQLQNIKDRMKESEAKWHEESPLSLQDLSRWKSRRRSANSDLHRKREEREQIELMTSGGGASSIRTAQLTWVPEESPQESTSSHVQPHSGLTHQTRGADPSYIQGPSSRALHHSQPPSLGESTLASEQAFTPVAGSSVSSISSMPGPMSGAGVANAGLTGWSNTSGPHLMKGTSYAFSSATNSETTDSAQRYTCDFLNPPDQSSPTSLAVLDPEPHPQQGQDFSRRASLLESFYSGGTRMSATLPRGFRRSEGSSRLSTGVTPRPFGAKPSKLPSLPRQYAMDDSHKSLISGHRDQSLNPSILSSQGKVTNSADTGRSRSVTHPVTLKTEEVRQDRRDGRSSVPLVRSFVSEVSMTPSVKQTSSPVVVSEVSEVKVGQSEMRVCLNQKPNSERDFGFQAHWDSTGARIKSVQAGSPAELCGLQMGDEIVGLGGCRVADMNYEQFKSSMDVAQQKGSLLMDIRRHGQNGRPEHYVTVSKTSDSPVETVKSKVNGQPANGVPSKMVNGSFQDNPVAVKNKGGSESAISDLPVPSISATSSRWSWDPEEERRRQEKWQMEQERLLQEKYRRDQEKLEAEWRRAQQEVYGEEQRALEEQKTTDVLSNGNATPSFPPPFFNQSTASTSMTANQNTNEAGLVQNRQATAQIAVEQHSQKTQVECDSPTKNQWSEESYGFAKLTVSDRTKSKSTPTLEGLYRQDAKAGSGKKKAQQSQAEQERLQILEEMRKKTPLLTDNSWIRQRNTSINKEPITVGTSIRRYESLDNLHTNNSWSRHSYTSGVSSRPHSAMGTAGPYRPGRSSLSPGSAIFSNALKQSSAFGSNSPTDTSGPGFRPSSQQRGRLVSGRRMCSRCEQPLGKGAAMVIDSLELCFHIGCFKCVRCRTDLGRGAECRSQVRVRHGQLFCNNCYSRFRVRPAISK